MAKLSVEERVIEVALYLLELKYGPLVAPYEWSGGVEQSFHTILAEVRSATATGWGEGGFFQQGDALVVAPALLEPWFNATAGVLLGQPASRYRELAASITSRLLPDPQAEEDAHPWRMARTAPLIWEPAAVAVEFALWDLFSRLAGIPFRTLCGPARRQTIPLCPAVGAMAPDRAAQIAKELAGRGFNTIKFKGGRDIDLDRRIVEEVRRHVNDSVSLRLDPNGAYDVGTARRLAHAVEHQGVEYLEEPCAFDDLAGFAALRRSTPLPVALDEAVTSASRIVDIVRAQAADVVMLEFHQLGGVERTLQASAVAEACGLPIGLHSSYVTGIRTAAVLHFAAATPNLRYAPDTVYHDLQRDVLESRLSIVDGKVALPAGPGIGVEVDRQALADLVQYELRSVDS